MPDAILTVHISDMALVKSLIEELAEARERIAAQQIVIDQLRAQLETRARIIEGEELP